MHDDTKLSAEIMRNSVRVLCAGILTLQSTIAGDFQDTFADRMGYESLKKGTTQQKTHRHEVGVWNYDGLEYAYRLAYAVARVRRIFFLWFVYRM